MEPTVIYEDAEVVVIDKLAGMSVHGDGRHDYPTLVDWLMVRYPDIKGVGENMTLADGTVIERPGIVHRIDRETSGVMLVARTQRAFEVLKRQFKNREVKKVYRAFVYGPFKDERGIIDKPIGSSRGGLGSRSARSPYGGMRDALTSYKVLGHKGEGASAITYVEVFPKTGRTHQIRVHFAAIQRPIVCDRLYAAGRPTALGFDRLALHAFSVSFRHPNGEEMTFTAPLPADFAHAEREIAQ